MSFAKKLATGIADTQQLMDKLQSDTVGFEKLANMLKQHAGINMTTNDKNLTLMASRLVSILKKYQLQSYRDYFNFLSSAGENEFSEFIFSLTTNTTHFFREAVHFDVLKEKMSEIIGQKRAQNSTELRVWCSASSTGQEVYTILMVLLNQFPVLSNWRIHFLATDIDREVLERAAAGIYQDSEMNGVADLYRQKFFQSIDASGRQFQVKQEFRKLIRFAPFNLLSESYPFQHMFDIIFCRNVLIYFDRPTSEGVIEKMAKNLRAGGLLFLGHSETGMMRSKMLKPIASGAYMKIGS